MSKNTIIIANEKCRIEQTAIDQLNGAAMLPGVVRAVGLPDLHAGKTPIGAVVETRSVIYPHLVGNDIGCGMGLFDTGIAMRKYKQDRFVSRLNNIRKLEDIISDIPYDEPCPIYDFGTIGSGNHFAELEKIEKIYDEQAFAACGIPTDSVLMLVHSGSRGYGQRILSRFGGYAGLPEGSAEAAEYLAGHDNAVVWAERNRLEVCRKLVDRLGFSCDVRPLLDSTHNYIERRDGIFVHRKGAVSAEHKLVVIPGSRGSLTYIVKPSEDTDISANSVSHGAGRKWPRSMCRPRIRDRYDRDTIRQTQLGSRVVCHDTELLYEEAPEAYKNITHIIAALEEHGLISVVATMRPLITYKG